MKYLKRKFVLLVPMMILFFLAMQLQSYAQTLREDQLNITWIKKDYLWVLPSGAEGTFQVAIEGEHGKEIFGLIDQSEREIVPPTYWEMGWFIDERAVVASINKYGFIDTSGKVVIPLEYEYGQTGIPFFKEGLVNIWHTYPQVFLDKQGKVVLTLSGTYNRVEQFHEGMAQVYVGSLVEGKIGYIDRSGKEVIPVKYDEGSDFRNGLATVWINGKCGMIDKKGKIVIPFVYDALGDFSEGLIYAKKDGKASYIDRSGKQVLTQSNSSVFSYGKSFEGGMALVEYNQKYGYIDKTGKQVIPFSYEYLGKFSGGLAIAKKNGKYGYIDKTGKQVIPFSYEELGEFSGGLAIAKKNGKYGYIDKTGKEVIPFIFKYAHSFDGKFTTVKKDGRWGILKKPELASTNDASYIKAKYNKIKLQLNGKVVDNLEAYSIENTTYVKLRDIAMLAQNTNKRFSVGWDNMKKLITLEKSKSYISNGTELKASTQSDKFASVSKVKIEVDGKAVTPKAYTIEGSNYFRLRDLGDALNFKVEWNDVTKTIEVTMK